ncbi:hypothetical protein SEA_ONEIAGILLIAN_66 [Microbacterium phage OneinaGillian]|uniref:Uncharacterized protein n=1 Tax=Microbacterium phage OneinaGillian TaxID=2301604 RepID=A0A385UGB2_9CAUD|nr:hypothetical protein HOU23_gp066 [Microbacterium phage OneinaGillian]AYB70176.1 hypothetical protein SEA_ONEIAGILLIAN_66 [Microbacterium phage OneinaGillian]WNN94093.1 hypothetical protein SEA_FREGLEY_68 [Microbacterium phage Fregley]
MSERDRALKLGLLLTLIEGWASRASLAGRLHMLVEEIDASAEWLAQHGFVTISVDDPISYRWAGGAEFEALWALLIPERPCPMRFRTTLRRPRKSSCNNPVAH